jgi:ubiquinol-cytochrome c reductase cytochrome c1 subunit
LLDNEDVVHAPHYPWRHTGYFSSFDHAALRRGFQVYREVCASCHSLDLIRYRELIGVTHTTEEIKDMAKDVDVLDGPNMQGEMFERPGKPYDKIPRPYANKEAGRAANGGAYPPDLSLMVKARHNGVDYVFALLTGYCDPPAGKEMMPGLHYNPYFPGGAISMPPPLNDEGVEYEDGTVATISQQFLNWTSEPESEDRKKNACKYLTILSLMALSVGYYKRWKWSNLKTRQISYVKGITGTGR